MNRGEIRAEALENSFDVGVYTPRVNRYINDALGVISRKVRGVQRTTTLAVSTVPGVETVDLPVDFVRLDFVSVPASRDVLSEVDEEAFEELSEAAGHPRVFCFGSSSSPAITPALRLWPTPDKAVTLKLRYLAGLPKLTVDTDVPAIHEDFHHMLVTYARSRAFRSEDDFEAATYYMQEFSNDLVDMRSSLARSAAASPFRTPGMYGDSGRELS